MALRTGICKLFIRIIWVFSVVKKTIQLTGGGCRYCTSQKLLYGEGPQTRAAMIGAHKYIILGCPFSDISYCVVTFFVLSKVI